MANDDDKTKMYKISTPKTNTKSKRKNEKKKGEGKPKKKRSKFKKFLKIFIIIFILLCLIGIGVFAAIFFGDTWNMTKDDLVIKMQNSVTIDKNGKVLHEIRGEENRKIIPLSEMGEYLPKA